MTVRGPAEASPAAADEAADASVETATVATGQAVLPILPMSAPPAGVCRYLRAADGSHRTAAASKEHRCWAVEPPSTLPGATQQELCLGPAHTGCERYLMLQERRAAALAADQIPAALLDAPRFAPSVSVVPVAVDVRPSGREMGSEDRRRRLPSILIGTGVAVVAIVVIIALLGGGAFLGADATPTAPAIAGAASDGPTATVRPAMTPTPVATPAATVAPSAAVADPTPPSTSAPLPSFTVRRMYTVRKGDTWRSLARRFGLRPRDLRAVNPIRGQLKVGTVIVIPASQVVTD